MPSQFFALLEANHAILRVLHDAAVKWADEKERERDSIQSILVNIQDLLKRPIDSSDMCDKIESIIKDYELNESPLSLLVEREELQMELKRQKAIVAQLSRNNARLLEDIEALRKMECKDE